MAVDSGVGGGAGGTIAAQEGALKRGAKAVEDARDAVNARIRAIESDMTQLRAFWYGEASGAFDQLMLRWRTEARKVNDVLIELEASIRGTEKDQIAQETEHKTTISGLGSMMGAM